MINDKTGTLSLLDNFLYAPLQSVCDESMCVTLMRTQRIKPYTEITLPVYAPKYLNNTSVILEESTFAKRYPIVVASVLTFVKNNKALGCIANMNPYVVTLKKGLRIAKILQKHHILSVEKVSDLPQMNKQEDDTDIPSRAELNEFHEKYGFKICPSLDEDKRNQVLRLLYKYRSVFACDVTEIKACKGPPLKLDVHTNRKTFQRQYRLSDTDKTEITRQINQMLDADVIETSDTPYYNCPICLVAKKIWRKTSGSGLTCYKQKNYDT